MRLREDGHVIAGYRGREVLRGLKDKPAKPRDLTELGRLCGFFATRHDHGAGPGPRAVPAP